MTSREDFAEEKRRATGARRAKAREVRLASTRAASDPFADPFGEGDRTEVRTAEERAEAGAIGARDFGGFFPPGGAVDRPVPPALGPESYDRTGNLKPDAQLLLETYYQELADWFNRQGEQRGELADIRFEERGRTTQLEDILRANRLNLGEMILQDPVVFYLAIRMQEMGIPLFGEDPFSLLFPQLAPPELDESQRQEQLRKSSEETDRLADEREAFLDLTGGRTGGVTEASLMEQLLGGMLPDGMEAGPTLEKILQELRDGDRSPDDPAIIQYLRGNVKAHLKQLETIEGGRISGSSADPRFADVQGIPSGAPTTGGQPGGLPPDFESPFTYDPASIQALARELGGQTGGEVFAEATSPTMGGTPTRRRFFKAEAGLRGLRSEDLEFLTQAARPTGVPFTRRRATRRTR